MKAAIPVVVMPAMVVFGYRSVPRPAPSAPAAEASARVAPRPEPRPERKAVETKADDTVARHEKARLALEAEAETEKRRVDASLSADPEMTVKEDMEPLARANPLGRSPAPIPLSDMREPERKPGEPALVGDGEECKTCRQVESQADIRVSFLVRRGLGGRQQTYPVVQNLRPRAMRDVEVTVVLDGRRRTWKFAEIAGNSRVSGLEGLDVPLRRGYSSDIIVRREGLLMGKHVPRAETVCDPGTGRGSLAFQESGK